MAFYDQALEVTEYHIVTKRMPYCRKLSQACPDSRGMDTDPIVQWESPFFLGYFLSLL